VEELLSRKDVQVVNICTPSGAHLDPAVAAAAAGKHVVVEKPLEITLERCDRIIEACRKAGVKLCTIFPSRFGDANQALRRALDSGRCGTPTLADPTVKWWRPQSYYDDGAWRGTWALDGGGALMNQAIHNVDLLQWLMGPVKEIAAFTATRAHERIEVEDTAAAVLRFASGAIGTIEAATSAFPGLLKTIAVHGDKGSAAVEQERLVTWQFAEELPTDAALREKLGAAGSSTGGAADPKAISFEGHRRQLEDFAQAIRAGRAPLVDGAEGRRSVEIILGIYKSQQTGAVVKLPL
ncbi:MAG TPA: Gfo/Idh/MocA family oxidoreductase, partial [Planctomycetia bacterium]|nr:Gfo/Idh/MocA family oxidoreductase [Planctomycetia bacterium]